MDVETDASAIAASERDPARFGVIFDRHATVLYRYFVRRVGVDDADALLGDVFRVAFEKRKGYDRTRPDARPWLYGIATNLLAQRRRREVRRLRATARLAGRRELTDRLDDDLVDQLELSELWPRVADAVAHLPDGERDALLLYAWEGLGYEEIAVALDIPVGTVRSRLNRARLTLRELRAPIGREP
jgi:RNA polymerase sigma-70 factor (ECF subfamily)